jgi:hypothetical protein
MKLRELAHARAGDKGNISNIAVIAYHAEDFPCISRVLTAQRVSQHFQGLVHGDVARYELPKLSALNFVLQRALGGGVTRSLALDAHGKCLSSIMLDIEVGEQSEPAAKP